VSVTEPYLVKLTTQLIDGIEKLPDETRAKHADYIRSLQRPDGGWPGREGGSDLYYTGFALRSLAVLQALEPAICESAAGFLRSKMGQPSGVVDFFSLLVACHLVPLGGGPDVLVEAPPDWRERVGSLFDSFRTADGGYGKVPGAPGGSTYTSFLVCLAHELLGRPIPEPEILAKFVHGRQREDGGFVEIAAMKRSGTNPTAAGVGVLQILNALDDATRDRVVEFLVQLPTELEGGFRANDPSPPPIFSRPSPAPGRSTNSAPATASSSPPCGITPSRARCRPAVSTAASGTKATTWSTPSTASAPWR
jgi:geranylgeranyl transferase type-2 subunit beta